MLILATSFVQTWGIPGLIGVVLGAAIGGPVSYHYGKKLLDDQEERRRKTRREEVQIEAADRVEVALNRIRSEALGAEPPWGTLHNQWQDEVMLPALRIDNEEAQLRTQAVAYMIGLAMRFPDNGLAWGVMRAIDSATEGLRAFLRQEPLPPRTFLVQDELHAMIWKGPGRAPNFEGYLDWVEANA